jgi:hypothetical protein
MKELLRLLVSSADADADADADTDTNADTDTDTDTDTKRSQYSAQLNCQSVASQG